MLRFLLLTMIIQPFLQTVAKSALLHASPAILPATAVVASAPATAATVLPQLLSTAMLISGGGATKLPDLGRLKLRLDGFHTYSVITSLLMNASLRLFSSTPKNFQENDRLQNCIKGLFSIVVAISIISGSYTTIVFSLMGLYTKRALGRGAHMDQSVIQFFQETTSVRELAYDTCLVSLVAFQASFVLSLYLNHDAGWNWKVALGGAVATIACWWQWSTVMTLATSILQLSV